MLYMHIFARIHTNNASTDLVSRSSSSEKAAEESLFKFKHDDLFIHTMSQYACIHMECMYHVCE